MGFDGDGFVGDGFLDSAPVEIANALAFVREGQRINVYVEFEARPRLADRLVAPVTEPFNADGFSGDGFTTSDFLTSVATAPVTVRVSSLPTNFKADDPVSPHLTSRAIIRSNIRFKTSFDERIDGASAQIQIGAIEFDDSDGYITEINSNYRIDGAPVRIYVLPERGSGDELVLVATAYGETIQTDQRVGKTRTATLKLTDLQGALNRPIQTDSFTGLGSTGGDPSLVGRLKPCLWGKRKNIEGVLYNAENFLYMVNNAEVTFGEGRFGGEIATLYGNYSSEAALIAARSSMPEGTWATCSNLGIYTVRPTGDGAVPFVFTVEAIGRGGAQQVGDVVGAILRYQTPLRDDQIDYSGLAALNVGVGGRYLDGSTSVTVQSVVYELARGVFGRLVLGDAISAVLFRDPAEVSYDTILSKYAIASSLRNKGRIDAAYREFQVRYSPNDAVLTEDQIVLPESDTAYKQELQRQYETLTATAGELTPTEHLSASARYVHNSSVISDTVASTIQERLKRFGQYERNIWELELRADEIDIALGAIVYLEIPEHEYWQTGRNALVVGKSPQFTKGRVLVDLLV